MGLGPVSGTAGTVAAAIGAAGLFLGASVGAAYIAISLTGGIILSAFGLL